MKATRDYGPMATRARLALDAGCDMILVCNDRDAAQHAVAALVDYSNPLSLVRFARLHGTGHPLRETLLVSDEWLAINRQFARWSDRPELHLDA
jgi:beta-N-acetylhexosaminidase